MARGNFYNVPSVAVVIDGTSGIDFADEFAIRATFPEDLADTVVGVDKVSTTINRNPTATIEVSYKPTSTTNDQLLTIYQDQLNGFGRLFPITVNTGVNETLHFNNCALKKAADVECANAMSMRTYTLTCEEFRRDQTL